jgi:UDP-N-acetyl-D-glucosamine dehydrogenase
MSENGNKYVEELKRLNDEKCTSIAVVGIGYVGLPLAVSFAEAGFTVAGYDVVEKTIAKLKAGHSHISDVPDEAIARQMKAGRLDFTIDAGALAKADALFVCVPTPFTRNKQPDISFIIQASEDIADNLRPGQLIVIESTTFPGTTVEVILPILRKAGLKEGHDYFVAFSPERVDPGRTDYTIANMPKVVGGINRESTDICCHLYGKLVGEDNVVPVSGPTVAEMVKLLENTFRSVNIALIYELTYLCHRMGIDIWETVEAAKTKPFGYMPFYPGPGVGGHCIPVDPYYLYWKAKEYDFHTRFIEVAAETNLRMPEWVDMRIHKLLNKHGKTVKGAKILALGVTFKPNINDARNSPAVRIIEMLISDGADVEYADPYVPSIIVGGQRYDYCTLLETPVELRAVDATAQRARGADLVLLLVDHEDFDYPALIENSKLFFDTRNVVKNYPELKGKVELL